jgi:VacB/RNase II family 3'-5' exoribonuclease
MAKAVYTAGKTSHFGLAFPFYTHFTSPIRRYPDLIAHRILYQVISNGSSETTENEIERIAKHCSNKEQQAVEAERASSKHMMARLMEKHKDEELQAVITGITEWGIFATVTSYHAEGLIRIMDIKGDRFLFIEPEKKLIGQRTRKSYHLGDTITVKVKKTDPIKRIIDFYLLD